MRRVLPLLAALLAGCVGTADWTKEPLPVTVSAANYSQGSEEQIYAAVHGARNTHPVEPAFVVPDKPLFYGFVPGDIYDSNVPLETVYRELAVGLAHRGYFNVVYQANAGYFPTRVDYLIRVHCGVRRWRNPIVRTDKVTWGDDAMISSRRDSRSVLLHGEGAAVDPRAGLDPNEAVNLAALLQGMKNTTAGALMAEDAYSIGNRDDGTTRDTCLVVLEAFKFSDLMTLKGNAPCTWATFVAVPLHEGQEFSSMLRTMVQKVTPYFGTTADGLQEYDVPQGQVLMGEPVVVPGPQAAH
ncbi:MAG TPA: hypothetical protein VII43_09155 [Opitutaceae bacterium]